MAMQENVNVRLGDNELAIIEAEQKRLAAQGVRVSKSQAVRTLILRGSAVTNKANGDPATVQSEHFKMTG